MAKKRSRLKTPAPSPPPKPRPSELPAWKKLAIGGFGLLFLIGAIVAAHPWKQSQSHSTDPAISTLTNRSKTSAVTFTKDIAPIIFNHCSRCHRSGQPGPFNLLTYADVQKRAKQIASVTSKRIMPPWPPEPGINEFVGQRILSPEQVRQLQEWVQQGAPEGAPSDLPPLPHWADGWALGKPDLVLTMPQPYLLPSDGQDIYRNFVIPMSLPASRFIRAVEFQPASPRRVRTGLAL